LDYEASYQLDSSIFGHANFGTFTFTFNGNYLARYTAQNRQSVPGSKRVLDGHFIGPRRGALPKNRWYASLFYDLGGLDVGATVHFVGQYYDLELAGFNRKIREWTTLDLIVNYTFNLPQPVIRQVPGYARDRSRNVKIKDGEANNT